MRETKSTMRKLSPASIDRTIKGPSIAENKPATSRTFRFGRERNDGIVRDYSKTAPCPYEISCGMKRRRSPLSITFSRIYQFPTYFHTRSDKEIRTFGYIGERDQLNSSRFHT